MPFRHIGMPTRHQPLDEDAHFVDVLGGAGLTEGRRQPSASVSARNQR